MALLFITPFCSNPPILQGSEFFLPNSKARIYGDARQVSLSSLIVSVKRFNDFCLQSITVSLLPSASGSGGGVGGPFDTSQSF